MADGLAEKVRGLVDGVEDVAKPEIAEMRKHLAKYVEAEGRILPAVQKLNSSAAGLLVRGLAKVMTEAKGSTPEGVALKKRKRDLDQVNGQLEALGTALDGIVEGTGGAAAAVFPGERLQQLLDDLEFKDKGPSTDLRNMAKAYYPLESAGRKKLAEWAVQLDHLVAAANRGLEALDPTDQVENLNLQFGRNEVIKPALELKRKIAALGV
jgi:hypothetical protein